MKNMAPIASLVLAVASIALWLLFVVGGAEGDLKGVSFLAAVFSVGALLIALPFAAFNGVGRITALVILVSGINIVLYILLR